MPELVLATQNPGKIAELRDLLAPAGYTVLGLADVGELPPEPDETGETFEENATIKALAYAEATGRLCLADDSGLEVDALGGRPGVISSHFAWDGRTDGEAAVMSREQRDRANSERLMAELAGVASEDRAARFVCTMVLAAPYGGADFQSASTPSTAFPNPPSLLPQTVTYDGMFKEHRRRLPHMQKANGTYFISFNLLRGTLSDPERAVVLESIKFWHNERYFLDEAVVMDDHVHMIIRPLEQPNGSWPELSRLMQSIKSCSARQVQKARGSTGQLWQREYHDRFIRNQAELDEKRLYIWNNPVKAGLCEAAESYPHRWTKGGRLEVGPTINIRSKTGVIAVTRGVFEGRIGMPNEVPRGSGGFGYDPFFLVGPDFGRTSAELDKSEKNRLSHRGMAVRAMEAHLRCLAQS